MPRRKGPPAILEVEKPQDAAVPTVDGTIGVEYSPPPIPEEDARARYICGNCKGELVLLAHSCAYCESEIDWSSLDAG